MRKNWLLLILAMFLVSVQSDVYGQQQRKEKYRNKANDPVEKLPYYKKLRWTDDLFKAGSYFNAIEYYQQLKQEKERNPYLAYQLAECYWMTRDYVPAAHYYDEAYALASAIYPEAIFKAAMMYKMQGEYNIAIAKFNQFISDNPKDFKSLRKRAEREIQGAEMALKSIQDPIPVTLLNAGPNVNSAYTESAPYPIGDSLLLFSTMRQNEVVEVDRHNRENYMSKLMISKKQPNVPVADSFQWALPFLDNEFNDPKEHVGNGSYSPGGDRFYFTKCREEDSMKVICRIYVSKFEGAAWSEPELLGTGINDGGSNTQPMVAYVDNKEVLFFSSNRTLQSRGGYDIWYSIIDPRSGRYRRPQNAGRNINTAGDEITPYYDSREGKLYFASNGWVTMGGFDIYSAEGGPSRYSNLMNLGYPINTSADELYYIKDPVGKPDAYVVSNRIGSIALKNPTCCDDIWRIQYEPKLMVMGEVVNCNSQEPVTNLVVKMVDQNGQLKTYNSTDGAFAFNIQRSNTYVVTADKAGFSSSRATINTNDVRRSDPDDTAHITICLSDIKNAFRVSNVFYDYDKATLRPESISSLDSLVNFMRDNPSLSVEIYSYTDAKGSEDYNRNLSERRAQSVKDYLVNSGIEESRMIVKGFGEKMPAAPNTTETGRDNPIGRQLNRRTEFRIVTDVPTRRIIFNSAKPGSIDEQQENLQMDDSMDQEDDSDFDTPGNRVNME